ncbi:hypothetical protein SDC9_172637 [bioreactor metagenome]|uniref:Uncharacterized protein n=1 Tax=bioreactor metagenome TaxID=1076179 RepID=A0A645GGG2_9ZZZZ
MLKQFITPKAVSIATIILVLPTFIPHSLSIFSISASTAITSSTDSVIGILITSTPALTTAAKSCCQNSVASPFIRTTVSIPNSL